MANRTKKTNKKGEAPETNEVLDALYTLQEERGIPVDFYACKIRKAIITACKNSYGNENVIINIDKESGKFEVYLKKTVVEEVVDPGNEVSLERARKISPTIEIGGAVGTRLDTKQFGRIAAQTARNIIRQGIRDGERGQMMRSSRTNIRNW